MDKYTQQYTIAFFPETCYSTHTKQTNKEGVVGCGLVGWVLRGEGYTVEGMYIQVGSGDESDTQWTPLRVYPQMGPPPFASLSVLSM